MAKGRKPLPQEEKSKAVTFRLRPELLDKVQRIAFDNKRSTTFLVDLALSEYVERYEKKHGPLPERKERL